MVPPKKEWNANSWNGKRTRWKDKARDVSRNDENVRLLAYFSQQEESKRRRKDTVRDGRREEGIVGGGE